MSRLGALLQLHTAVLLFGLSGLFGKWLSVDPAVLVFARTAVAAAAIYALLRWRRQTPSLRRGVELLWLGASAAVLALHWASFFQAIQVSTVAIGLLGFATFPVFVTLVEPMLARQSLRPVDLCSAATVVVGLCFVAGGFEASSRALQGLAWAVLSGALFAGLTLFNRRLVVRQGALSLSFFQLAVAALLSLPWALWRGETPSAQELGLLLVLGLLCTAVAHALFVHSLRRLKAQLASVVAALEPVYGIALAAWLLAEIPSASTLLGAVLILVAVMLAMRAHR